MPTDLKGIDTLSERQKEVLRLTAQHLQAKEIARKLDITERTVRAHTESARRRLNAATSREAVRIFMAYEGVTAIVKNDQWPPKPIAETVTAVANSGHEQALSSAQRTYGNQLHTVGVGLANAGSAQKTPTYTGRNRDRESHEPGPRTRESDFQYGRGLRLVDGRWDAFKGRLTALSAFQWLAIVIGIAVLMPVILALLVQATTNAIGVFQTLQASTG